jgi:hypothetical protein
MSDSSHTRRGFLGGMLGGAATLLLAREVPAQASGSAFNIEVVLFRQPGALPPADRLAALPPRGAARTGKVQLLPAAQWQLGNVDGALRRRGDYRVLGHGAWQSVIGSGAASTVRVEDVMSTAEQVTGDVALQRGTYLTLRIDLTYAPSEGSRYVLSERRRIKYNERHYFDHPAFGAIVLISPAKALLSG